MYENYGEQAYNQMVMMEDQCDNDGYWSTRYYSDQDNDFKKDKTFYFTKRKYKRIKHETAGAYLFEFKKGEAWVPKALCKKHKKKKCKVHILSEFKFNYIKT